MQTKGTKSQEKQQITSAKKIIKFPSKKFENRPEDAELYALEEGFEQRFDKRRLLRESTLECNGFSDDVMEFFPDKAKEILTIAREGVYEDRKTVLQEMADAIGASVSVINGSNHWQDDWQHNVAAYLDIGSRRNKTVIYDTITEEFSVMSVDDFILRKDQEYGMLGSERL